MRNIKTSLRFARNSALLFVAASGMSYLTSCSETEITPGNVENGDDTVLVEQLGLTTGSNPSLAKSYPNSRQAGTRAAFDAPVSHEVPKVTPTSYDLTLDPNTNPYDFRVTLPAEAKAEDYANLTVQEGLTVYVKPGTHSNGLPATLTVVYTHQDVAAVYDNMGNIIKPQNPYFEKKVQVKNPKYYVDGKVTVAGFGDDGTLEVHILNGAEFSTPTEFEDHNTVYLYNGGKLLRSGDENQIYLKCTVIADADISDANATITIPGQVYANGKIHGKVVKTIESGKLYAGCAVTAVDSVYLTNNSLVSAGYVSAPIISLDSNAKVELRDGGYMYAPEMVALRNVGTVFVTGEEFEDGYAPAMIETKTLLANNIDLKGTFQNIAIKYELEDGSKEGAFQFNENMMVKNSEKNTVEYVVVENTDGCAPKLVVKPTAPVDPTDPDETVDPVDPSTPTLENIGSVAPTDDHAHPISATCIFTNGQDAYLSWHTQGPNFHGCIEYLTVANGTVTLNSYLETSKDNESYGAVDFNHVIFDNGKIFVAGDHPKKGGILGWIECNDGAFVTGNAVLNMRQLYNGEGGSGNCIIRNGDYYQVASVKGFETFNVADFVGAAKPKSVAKLAAYDFSPEGMTADGNKISGKHIATDGQKVVMLTLINRDNDANTATASIKVYNASDVKYENEVASYIVNDAVLSPVDGKDVIAIQGDDIWVCLGQGGVQHLKLAGNTITKAAEFVLKNKTKEELKCWALSTKEAAASCANGLAVDGKYVYVAHGGAGLVVLNKEDLSLVTRTRYNGGNSANYVNLNPDGYIYVAYGKSNVQVFGWKK